MTSEAGMTDKAGMTELGVGHPRVPFVIPAKAGIQDTFC